MGIREKRQNRPRRDETKKDLRQQTRQDKTTQHKREKYTRDNTRDNTKQHRLTSIKGGLPLIPSCDISARKDKDRNKTNTMTEGQRQGQETIIQDKTRQDTT